MSRLIRRALLGALLPAVLVVVWHRASVGRGSVVPTIGDVLGVLLHPFADPPVLDSKSLAFSTVVSVARVLAGYLAAVFTAVPLGLIAGCSRWVRETVSPVIEMLRPICPVAWLPVAIILFGFASAGSLLYGRDYWQHPLLSGVQLAMVALIWWGGFFPVFLNTVHGVLSVRDAYLEAASVLGATRRQRFFKVVVPASLPSVLTGMRVAFGICWMVIIAAEFFPGTRGGLGYMITTAHAVARYEYAFASLVVIALLGLGLNGLFSLLTGTVGRWQAKER